MKIAKGTEVALIYSLNIIEEGETQLIEETNAEEPLIFIFKEDDMLTAFEEAMDGLSQGESFDFIIPMDQAYGPYREDNIAEFPKSDFLVDGVLDEETLEEGALIPMKDPEGNEYDAYVMEVKLNSLVLDFNHPLAGGDLHFADTKGVDGCDCDA